MTHTIRAAKKSDALQINEISQHLGYVKLSEVEAYEKLEFLINSSQHYVYISEIKGLIVGWIHIFYAPKLASESFYEIAGLVVASEYRNQGIGRSLVDYVFEHFKAKFRVRCNGKRMNSHQFYESNGFKSNKVQYVFDKNNSRTPCK